MIINQQEGDYGASPSACLVERDGGAGDGVRVSVELPELGLQPQNEAEGVGTVRG